ncbi:inositol monophosphatase family protein [Egicoccus sp. AB-alg6-2]|uniref:inositol monophosphatase family protein n=1 Tax=Egicoccus sp. AB-alg6-2 TaxID=3242692 RepID=UPI00359E2931
MTRLDAELAFAHDLADLADARTGAAFGGRQHADTKADGTWVTAVDVEVERTLREAIRRRFPDHAVLGEEDGLAGPAGAPTWVIDPIDGTSNFVKGNPVFATLIGLRVDDDDVLGVVSAPALRSRWAGVVGVGADHNGHPIQVSDVADLASAEIAFGGLDYFRDKGHGDLVAELAARTGRQRGYGDFWQHCLVASGSTDIAIEAEVNLWDLVAVKAVVEAAGGRFTSLDGTRTADGGDALSTNGHLHDEVLAIVAAHR